MTLQATVYTPDGAERYDTLDAAIAADGDTWIHAENAGEIGVLRDRFGIHPLAMSELNWTYGYPATMLGMVLVAGLMLVHFRKQDWI